MDDKLLINLRILSQIQKNGKITRSFDGIISLENENFYQFLKRFLSNDSRKQSISEINSIINDTIKYMENIINSKFTDINLCKSNEYYKNCSNLHLILIELKNAVIGINNLKFTYKNDINTNIQLDILLVKINSFIEDITHKLIYFHSYLPENLKFPLFNNQKNPHYYDNENTMKNVINENTTKNVINENTNNEIIFEEDNSFLNLFHEKQL